MEWCWDGGVLKTRRTGDDGHIVGQREVVRAPSLARQLNFGELWLGELRRIPIPRTSVNKVAANLPTASVNIIDPDTGMEQATGGVF